MKDKFYYKDGTTSSDYDSSKVLHREDGPAVERADGDRTKAWYIDGKHHRTDGPAVEYADGGKEWWVDGKQHREDGPAVEHANGDKIWYIDNERHRTDGPAVEWVDGYKSWYIDGRLYSEEDFNKFIEEVKQLPLALRLIDPREWVRLGSYER